MSKKGNKAKDQEQSLLDIIQQVKTGQIDPNSLDKETKIQLTELLRREAYTVCQIAQILKTSDRTIKRYAKIVRKRNALTHHPEFTAEFAGELIASAEQSVNRLIRLSMSKDINGPGKIQAESAAWRIRERLTKLLQSMGHLDSQLQNAATDLSHKGAPFIPPKIDVHFVSVKDAPPKDTMPVQEEKKSNV
ncbi:MAG: hypothetical protein NT088_03005 [Candidatus Omnitrophica bacterium]|nr:hypothetical protein [Candidatus Omnitrophota bacterium]